MESAPQQPSAQSVFCPATMCPLFAAGGSPWTGERDAVCPERQDDRAGGGCGFFEAFGATTGRCGGCVAAHAQVAEVARDGDTLQVGPSQGSHAVTPRSYDCQRAHQCQWQRSSDCLCPPRTALREGIDPRYCAW